MKKVFYSLLITAIIVAGCTKGSDSGELSKNSATATGASGSITRFTSFNNYLYALDQNKIKVYDISNASDPKLVNEVQTAYGLETITLYEGTIYIGSRTALYIMDITNPEAPQIISETVREGALAGGCDPVSVKNNYVFSTVKIIENVCGVVNTSSRLLVYDATDKMNPILVDEEAMNMPNGLGYKDNTLFVCDDGDDRVVMYDITNPANTTQFLSFEVIDPVDVIVNGNRMVISTKTGFSFYDVTNINDIQSRGSIEIH